MHWVHLRLDRYGKKENAAKRRQWQRVQELFRGYPEVEINQAYQRLRGRFETGLTEISRCREGMETLHRVPSALIETGMAAALLLVLTVVGGGFGTDAWGVWSSRFPDSAGCPFLVGMLDAGT